MFYQPLNREKDEETERILSSAWTKRAIIAKLKVEVRAKNCTETPTHKDRQEMICAERTKNDKKSRDTLADEGREYF